MKNMKRHQVTITFDVDLPADAAFERNTFSGIAREIREDFCFMYFYNNNNRHERFMDGAKPKNVRVDVKKPKK